MQNEIPVLKDVNYIVKIAKNRLSYLNSYKLKDFLCDYMSFDEVEDIKDIVKSSRNWTDLRESLYEYFDVSEGL